MKAMVSELIPQIKLSYAAPHKKRRVSKERPNHTCLLLCAGIANGKDIQGYGKVWRR